MNRIYGQVNMRKNKLVYLVSNVVLLIMTVTIGALTLGGAKEVSQPVSAKPYYGGDTSGDRVALMINVYWGTEYLVPMLDELDKAGAKCTFFVGGSWARANSEVLSEIVNRGHEIGNHGYSHLDHSKMSAEKNIAEIQKCESVVQEITGIKTTLFAPPSGAQASRAVQSAQSIGYKTIMWSRDTIDWRDKDADIIYKRATSGIKAGDFVLMHPTKATLEALPKILAQITFLGFRASSVSECLSYEF